MIKNALLMKNIWIFAQRKLFYFYNLITTSIKRKDPLPNNSRKIVKTFISQWKKSRISDMHCGVISKMLMNNCSYMNMTARWLWNRRNSKNFNSAQFVSCSTCQHNVNWWLRFRTYITSSKFFYVLDQFPLCLNWDI